MLSTPHPLFDTPLSEQSPPPTLSPTTIAQFVSRSQCRRFLEFELSDSFQEAHESVYSHRDIFTPLNPALAADGIAFEQAVDTRVGVGAATQVSGRPQAFGIRSWQQARRQLISTVGEFLATETDGHLVLTQAALGPALGVWNVSGIADYVLVWKEPAPPSATKADTGSTSRGAGGAATESRLPHLRVAVVDAKATTDEQVYHQIQVATYTLLVRQLLSSVSWLANTAHSRPLTVGDGETIGAGPAPLRFTTPAETVSVPDAGAADARPDALSADARAALQAAYPALSPQLGATAAPNTPCEDDSAGAQPVVTWDLVAGVITRDTDIELPAQTPPGSAPPAAPQGVKAVTPESVSTFDLPAREHDVFQLLSATGIVADTWKDTPGDTPYTISAKCHSCPHQAACLTSAVEDGDLATVGASPAIQAQLNSEDITSIVDLAELADPPDDPRPTDEPTLQSPPGADDTLDRLFSDPTTSQSLTTDILEAQSLLGSIGAGTYHTVGGTNPVAIPGSRAAALPDDDPPFTVDEWSEQMAVGRGELIRAYLIPHRDPRFDRLFGLSVHVTASAADTETSTTTTVLAESVPTTRERATDAEGDLLERAADTLTEAITTLGAELDVRHPIPQLYTYSAHQQTALKEATRRHSDRTPALTAVARLCNTHPSVDGEYEGLVTVKPAVTNQFAFGTPADGLLQTWELLNPPAFDDAVAPYEFSYTRPDGTEINLMDAFRLNLFDYDVPYETPTNLPTLFPGYASTIDPDIPTSPASSPSNTDSSSDQTGQLTLDVAAPATDESPDTAAETDETPSEDAETDGVTDRIPLWKVQTSQLPVEYFGGVRGLFTEGLEEAITDHYEETPPTQIFEYVDAGADDPTPLIEQDIIALGNRLARVLQHIERAVTYKELPEDHTPVVDFTAVATEDSAEPLDEDSTEKTGRADSPATPPRAVREYLQVEHYSAQEELDEYLKLPVRARIATGEAIPMVVTETETTDDGRLVAEGILAYEAFFDDHEQVAQSCRHSGERTGSSGAWMVANGLTKSGDPAGSTSPAALKRGVPVTVTALDAEEGSITLTAFPNYISNEETDYQYFHRNWTTNPGEADSDTTVLFDHNEAFVLDPRPDDLTSDRLFNALQDASITDLGPTLSGCLTPTESRPGHQGQLPTEVSGDAATGTAATDDPPTEPAGSVSTTDAFPDAPTERFVQWATSALPYPPNEQQRAVIKTTDEQLVGVQGPPGTGKTAGATAPTLLARLFAAGCTGTPAVGVVLAESNKAVDELLETTAEHYATYTANPITKPDGTPVEFDANLVRLTDSPPATAAQPPGVDYVSYNDPDLCDGNLSLADVHARLREADSATGSLSDYGTDGETASTAGGQADGPQGAAPRAETTPPRPASDQSTIYEHDESEPSQTSATDGGATGKSAPANNAPTAPQDGWEPPADASGQGVHPHTLIFTTPSRLYKLIDTLDTDMEPSEWVTDPGGLFDLAAIDEASMAPLPSLFFPSSLLKPTGQLIAIGDHRQMPPIQQHEWDTATRSSILTHGTHLPTLDYLRLLRGDLTTHELPGEDAFTDTRRLPEARLPDLPFIQLEQGYRSHAAITEFLSEHVYQQDDLPYTTDQTATMPDPTPPTDGVAAAADPDAPFTLVVHDDLTHQQSNPTEAAITHALAQAVPESESLGVVTPHNAQRGLLADTLATADVDTVERYQGDERDVITVSATASDPEFIHGESDFLLNPNRLLVAMSRMKHKLTITAAESVFSLIPEKTDTYEAAALWKQLALTTLPTTPTWQGTLREFCPQATRDQYQAADLDTTITVYHVMKDT